MSHQQMDRPQQVSRPAVLERGRPAPQVPSRPSWTPLVTSAGATLLLIALLAGLLVAQARGRSRPTAAAAPVASVTPTTASPAGPNWQPIDTYSHVPGLLLAPSDPRTAYQSQLVSSKTSPTTLTLQRTRDAGATWQPIAPPAALKTVDPNTYDSPPAFSVSPLNANMVYLTAGANVPNCSSAGGQQFAGGGTCFFQYDSADAGATWRPLRLPVSGLLGTPRGQGARLWALISPAFVAQDTTAPAGRLARSVDGGATWTLADSGLPSSIGIGDFAPAPASNTIFVVTDRADRFNSGVCQGCLPPPDYKVWRSDDLGAHWSQASALPYQSIARIAVARDGATPILYLQALIDTQGTIALVASTDGGRDWAPAPSSGVAASSAQVEGTLAVLADGSAMLIFAPSGNPSWHTFYAYKPGDADWRPIAPQLISLAVEPPIISAPGADGSQTLTLLYQDQDGNLVATYSAREPHADLSQ